MNNEEILADFLSKDAARIKFASGKVLQKVITDKEMIESLVSYLTEIRNAVRDIDYGGGFLKNQRYVEKALMVIAESKWKDCLCEYAFADYGQSVESLQEYGFELLSKAQDGFVTRGVVECPQCHQRYEAEEEFTGWHMTSSRHRAI